MIAPYKSFGNQIILVSAKSQNVAFLDEFPLLQYEWTYTFTAFGSTTAYSSICIG